jgi:hypothetical protein
MLSYHDAKDTAPVITVMAVPEIRTLQSEEHSSRLHEVSQDP